MLYLPLLVVRILPVGDAVAGQDAPPSVPRPEPAHVLKHVLKEDTGSAPRQRGPRLLCCVVTHQEAPLLHPGTHLTLQLQVDVTF